MPKNPKKNEEKMKKALNALKTLAPNVKFNGKGVEELEAQINRSMAPRQRLEEIDNEKAEQIALRDSEDVRSLAMIDKIVAGIIGHDDFGEDSALYEAFGYIRKSDRKSGLTRKKKSSGNGENK